MNVELPGWFRRRPCSPGRVRAGSSAARHEAIKSARELLAGAIRAGQTEVPDAFVIVDEAGREIDVVLQAMLLPEALKK
jgi:uncharacterized protein DUF6894